MNKTGLIWLAAATATLLYLGACADFDKLDGTRTSDNRPQPGANRSSASSTDMDREQGLTDAGKEYPSKAASSK